jgi:leader peptidase (prepilin peptidase)/N-methyltransferase
MAAFGAVTGLGVPALIRRIPEPVVDTDAAEDAEAPVVAPKEPYAAIAALPGLAWKAAVAAAVVGALVGARLGWSWDLLVVGYLVPVGVRSSTGAPNCCPRGSSPRRTAW